MLSKCWGSLDGQALGIAVGKASQALGKARATSNFVAAELRTLELGGWAVGPGHHRRYHQRHQHQHQHQHHHQRHQ